MDGWLGKWIERRIPRNPSKSARRWLFPAQTRFGWSRRRPRRAAKPDLPKEFPAHIRFGWARRGAPAGRGPAGPNPPENGLGGGFQGARPNPRDAGYFQRKPGLGGRKSILGGRPNRVDAGYFQRKPGLGGRKSRPHRCHIKK